MASEEDPAREAQEQIQEGHAPGIGVPREAHPAKTGQVVTQDLETPPDGPTLTPAERREVATAMWEMGCGPTEIARALGIAAYNVRRYLPRGAHTARAAKRDDRQGCIDRLAARIAGNIFAPLTDAYRAALGLADDAVLPEDKYDALRKALHRSPAGQAVLEQRKLAREYGAKCEVIVTAYRKARAAARKPLKDEIDYLRDQAACFAGDRLFPAGAQTSPYPPHERYRYQDWDEAPVWAKHLVPNAQGDFKLIDKSMFRTWPQVRRELTAMQYLIDDAVAEERETMRSGLEALLRRANTDTALTNTTRHQVAAWIHSYLRDAYVEGSEIPCIAPDPAGRIELAHRERGYTAGPTKTSTVRLEWSPEDEDILELMGTDASTVARHSGRGGRHSDTSATSQAWAAAAGQ